MAFGTALTGLNAASEALNVTGNNIANAGTTGFKRSRAEFGDIYSTAYGGMSNRSVGSGVQLQAVTQHFTQGSMNNTGNSLDLAVNGKGFFVFSDQGSQVYSRAGALQVDRDGYVVNSQGQRLQVYAPISNSGSSPTFNQGNLTDVQLSTSAGTPQATSNVSALLDLSAQASDLGAGTINPSDATSYTYSTPATIYDSLGSPHTAIMYFRKDTTTPSTTTTAGSSTWDVLTQVDGNTVTTGGANQTQITFDDNGSLTSPANGQIAYDAYSPSTGASPLNLTLDLTGTSMFGDTNSVNSLTQNGYTSGRLSGIDVSGTGVISARYTNGQSQALGQVALADFANPQGLQPVGNTAWAQTFASGDVRLGAPGSGTFGQVQSGSLENSNVDLAKQLVNLITEQRDYQANAKVITTANTVTQTIIQMS
ncbi:MAG: flagellar hook protein FlgE [Acidihalobacter sp.]|uniref:flagellar hook protein FlgE n=1 Tax=Acidihalobacter sp. TaxID=1872108 RepID=UPI00307D5CC7